MTNVTDKPGTDSFLPTRQSLLARLRDNSDQAGWQDFFDAYWRLIYNVARKSGMADAEAQDVVQSTFIYLTRRMPKFRYDASRGSFKSWLRVVTRSRISIHFRKAKRHELKLQEPPVTEDEAAFDDIPDPNGDVLDELWQREWESHIVKLALRRVRAKVSSQQLLIFRLAALGELPLKQVARKLEVNLAQVYLARHRVGKLFKQEITKLRAETE
jgi:RNA polymerase sigma factor (sigma-70 family)